MKKTITIILTIAMSLALFAGCAQNEIIETTKADEIIVTTAAPETTENTENGGVIRLKVNPEIAISYDEKGNVTKIESRNADAKKILEGYTGYVGKPCKDVINELVTKIGDAGYFVEELDGGRKSVTIEIEKGRLPDSAFLDDIAENVRQLVNSGQWQKLSDYGITDYGVTDYYQPTTAVAEPSAASQNNQSASQQTSEAPKQPTAAKPGKYTDYNMTDYYDTDYGPNNDGVTDYHHSDYHQSDYHQSDYHQSDYGRTDYHHSDYGHTNYR